MAATSHVRNLLSFSRRALVRLARIPGSAEASPRTRRAAPDSHARAPGRAGTVELASTAAGGPTQCGVATAARLDPDELMFAGAASHELMGPLRSISGLASIVLEDHGENLPREGRALLERIVGSATEMSALVAGLMALCTASRAAMKKCEVDLSAMAQEIVTGLRCDDARAGVDVVVAPGLRAQADPVLVRIVLRNLLANAWKFTAARDRARIELGVRTEDGDAVHFVRDDGVGFSPEEASSLFVPFRRLHHGRSIEGHGLGLAIARVIVERHGGRIWAEGRSGEGATFNFALPP